MRRHGCRGSSSFLLVFSDILFPSPPFSLPNCMATLLLGRRRRDMPHEHGIYIFRRLYRQCLKIRRKLRDRACYMQHVGSVCFMQWDILQEFFSLTHTPAPCHNCPSCPSSMPLPSLPASHAIQVLPGSIFFFCLLLPTHAHALLFYRDII